MEKKLNILFVDDDAVLLQSLRRSFRPMRQEWNCEFAYSGKEALRILSQKKFDLIVSDMRMPEMDGAELLTQVKKLYPNTMRFILSGQAEEKAFLGAVGSVHQFLSKPCDSDTLKETINRGLSLRDYLSSEEIKKMLLRIDSLPSLPELYCKLMEELKSDNATLESIENIISKDVGMTAKVLQVANSAFFGSSQPVSSPAQAVQILGMDLIQALALTCQVFSKTKEQNSYEALIEKIWEHSIDVANLSLSLVKKEKMETDIENYSFTAGLLHDIGKIVLLLNFPEKIKEYMRKIESGEGNELEIENEVFGANHVKVGAYLIGLWGLPDPIVEAIAYHENPSQCPSKKRSPLSFVYIANYLAHEFGYGPNLELDEKYMKDVGLFDRLPEWQESVLAIKNEKES